MNETTGLPVLIVEDDPPTRRLLEAVLTRAGYPTAFAGNGGEAITLLRTNEYAVVVLDVMMPEVGGREVVAFIRAEALPVRVVLCSAAGPRVLAEFDPDIVKATVRKPFDVEQLIEAVRIAETSARA